jgi:hypothetical protein
MRAPTRAKPSPISSCWSKKLVAIAYDVRISEQASVAIGAGLGPAQHDLVAPGQRIKRGGGFRRCGGVLRATKRRDLDCGQADLAAVIEHESSSVENPADHAAGNLVAAAGLCQRLLFVG